MSNPVQQDISVPQRGRAYAFLPHQPRPIPFDEAESAIVTIVHAAQGTPLTGYEIVQRSAGKLNLNSVYTQLDRLVDLGVLRSEYAPLPPGAKPRVPKRLITLGDQGTVLFNHEKEAYVQQQHEQSRPNSVPNLPGATDLLPRPT